MWKDDRSLQYHEMITDELEICGDALGYAIEFMPEDSIFSKYGPEDITKYVLRDNVAQISDDTQMSLFTANGLLVGMTRGCMRGIPWRNYLRGDKHLEELIHMIDLAVTLSKNTDSDLNNIHRLGEGWAAEETLGIAIYCALKYQKDFSKAIITAVNHRGDSDSTGALTGNILGALVGYDVIESKWKQNLELIDVILEMADDLCYGCLMEEYSSYRDPAWESKYIHMHRAAF